MLVDLSSIPSLVLNGNASSRSSGEAQQRQKSS